ncbi:MAG: type II toxin-antitoxin system VapC family toxin [Planctomycetaceae bacterium]
MIDASVTLAWLFNEGSRGPALDRQIESLDLVAPWLWRLEVVNAILIRERRRQITQAQATRLLEALEALEIEIVGEPITRTLVGLAHTARPHQLTSYDAVYLDLATSLALPLLTDDINLRAAAERVGVPVVEPASA